MRNLVFIMIIASVAATLIGGSIVVFVEDRDAEMKETYSWADAMVGAGKYKDAESYLLERIPPPAERDGEMWLRLGILRSMQNDFAGAEQCFAAGLEAEPGEARILFNQALVFGRNGEPDKSEQALLKLKEDVPHHPEVRYHLGRLAEDRGDLETADAYYVEELNLNPASASAWKRHLMISKGIAGEDSGQSEL
jgi:tetratricopeptide (TPR) repeat protein